jgi:hypothetical protein
VDFLLTAARILAANQEHFDVEAKPPDAFSGVQQPGENVAI